MKYDYVPKCPKCGSFKTGHYIIDIRKRDENRTMAEYMKKGELIRIKHSINSSENNFFCEECGIEWNGKIQTVFLDKKQLEDIFLLKGICEERINELFSMRDTSRRNQKEEKKKKRKMKIKKMIRRNSLLDACGLFSILYYGSEIRNNLSKNKSIEEDGDKDEE